MTRLRLCWPVALSGICLVVAIYFSLTDTAFRLRGCRDEDYPEYAFLLIVSPVALVALILGTKACLPRTRSGPARRFLVGASLVLSILCAAYTIAALLEPGGGTCRPSDA